MRIVRVAIFFVVFFSSLYWRNLNKSSFAYAVWFLVFVFVSFFFNVLYAHAHQMQAIHGNCTQNTNYEINNICGNDKWVVQQIMLTIRRYNDEQDITDHLICAALHLLGNLLKFQLNFHCSRYDWWFYPFFFPVQPIHAYSRHGKASRLTIDHIYCSFQLSNSGKD